MAPPTLTKSVLSRRRLWTPPCVPACLRTSTLDSGSCTKMVPEASCEVRERPGCGPGWLATPALQHSNVYRVSYLAGGQSERHRAAHGQLGVHLPHGAALCSRPRGFTRSTSFTRIRRATSRGRARLPSDRAAMSLQETTLRAATTAPHPFATSWAFIPAFGPRASTSRQRHWQHQRAAGGGGRPRARRNA